MTVIPSCLSSEDHRPQVLGAGKICAPELLVSSRAFSSLSQACSLPSPFRCRRCRPGPQQLRAHRSARRASTVAFLGQGSPAAVLRHPAPQDRHCPHPARPATLPMEQHLLLGKQKSWYFICLSEGWADGFCSKSRRSWRCHVKHCDSL